MGFSPKASTFAKKILMKKIVFVFGSFLVMTAACTAAAQDKTRAIRVTPQEEHYIFQLNPEVTRTHVYYDSRFGIEIAGDLYVAKDLDQSKKYPAIVIGPPYGGVKEQGPGVYANELAQRGFVVLTFDPAYHGYSGGEPRYTTSTMLYAEDFCAGVDFLGTLPYVDREKIGSIGICGSGGFSICAASMDTRIKAVVTSAMYDISGSMTSMGSGPMRERMLQGAAASRWAYVDSGEATVQYAYPDAPLDEVPDNIQGLNREWWAFYATKRGWHPNARTNSNSVSMADMMTFPGTHHIADISPRPILFITGDIAHSRGMSEEAYARAAEPKELYVAQGNVMHIDLYDDVTKIPFDKIESFFKENLK